SGVVASDRREPGEGRRVGPLEAKSSEVRLAPSPGVQSSDGFQRRGSVRPRMDKREQGRRLRGSRTSSSDRRSWMHYAGIDIASQTHVVAVVDEAEEVLVRPTPFGEDAAGYEKLFGLLGSPDGVIVAMEATGHYWRNLVADLMARGFAVALINPLRTHRFAGEDLQRTKTDAIDALGIARFARQKRLPPTRLPDSATEELKELVRLRDRLVQDFGDREIGRAHV